MSDTKNTSSGGLTAGNTTSSLTAAGSLAPVTGTTTVPVPVTPVSTTIPATTVVTPAQTLEAFETFEVRLHKAEARLLMLEALPYPAEIAALKTQIDGLHAHLKQLIDPYNRRKDI